MSNASLASAGLALCCVAPNCAAAGSAAISLLAGDSPRNRQSFQHGSIATGAFREYF
jgi:hypothetical protein